MEWKNTFSCVAPDQECCQFVWRINWYTQVHSQHQTENLPCRGVSQLSIDVSRIHPSAYFVSVGKMASPTSGGFLQHYTFQTVSRFVRNASHFATMLMLQSYSAKPNWGRFLYRHSSPAAEREEEMLKEVSLSESRREMKRPPRPISADWRSALKQSTWVLWNLMRLSIPLGAQIPRLKSIVLYPRHIEKPTHETFLDACLWIGWTQYAIIVRVRRFVFVKRSVRKIYPNHQFQY